jgi:hypothetical protein
MLVEGFESIDMTPYRCSHSFAVEDVGAESRFKYINFAVGAVNYTIEYTTTDEVRCVDRSAITKTYTSIRTERGREMPFWTLGALLAQKQNVVLWMTIELA